MSGPLTGLYTGDDLINLEPPRASLGQLRMTNKLELIRVEKDVLGVAERLASIDRGLRLMHDKRQGIFILYHDGFNEHGQRVEQLVGAYTELDQRIINLIERIDAQGRGRHDLARELDKLEETKRREQDAMESERMGEIHENLRLALRKDLGLEGSRVMPGHSRGIYRNRAERRAAAKRKAPR